MNFEIKDYIIDELDNKELNDDKFSSRIVRLAYKSLLYDLQQKTILEEKKKKRSEINRQNVSKRWHKNKEKEVDTNHNTKIDTNCNTNCNTKVIQNHTKVIQNYTKELVCKPIDNQEKILKLDTNSNTKEDTNHNTNCDTKPDTKTYTNTLTNHNTKIDTNIIQNDTNILDSKIVKLTDNINKNQNIQDTKPDTKLYEIGYENMIENKNLSTTDVISEKEKEKSIKKEKEESFLDTYQVDTIAYSGNTDVNRAEFDVNTVSLQKDNQNIAQAKSSELAEVKAKIFEAPSVDEVRAYVDEKGYCVDADMFVDFYTSKGWVVGKRQMKDWKAKVRSWDKNSAKYNTYYTWGYTSY